MVWSQLDTFLLFYSLSELPGCHVPLAMKKDVINQTLAIALHPTYDCNTAIVAVTMFLNLTQSPEAHVHLAKKETVERMLEICEQKQKMSTQQGTKEDPMAINALRYIAIPSCTLHAPHDYGSHSLRLSITTLAASCLNYTSYISKVSYGACNNYMDLWISLKML